MKIINKLFKSLMISLVLLTIAACNTDQELDIELMTSPDGKLVVELSLVEGQLYYQVAYDSNQVVQKSRLGVLREDTDLSKNLALQSVGQAITINQDYKMLTGKQLKVSDQGKEFNILLKNPIGDQLNIQLQLYNSGFAFRYQFPSNEAKEVTVSKEFTEFQLGNKGAAWIMPYDKATEWTPSYEAYYESDVALGTISPTGEGWCFPALFQINNTWLHISDVVIDGEYAGVHLKVDSVSGAYTTVWPQKEEAQGLHDQLPSGTLPWQTSWRVYSISRTLDGILNSQLVNHLSPANRIEDTSWIKPGISSWSWLPEHDSPKDFEKLKKYVDLAVDMNWSYSLVDANWNVMQGGNIEQLVQYATSKNVGILLWYNSGGPNNVVTEMPRDLMNDHEIRLAEFKKLAEMGVKGVKIDFFQSDKQTIMKLYQEILEDAAEAKIMVNFHGASIPRGWARTYPNLITMESVKGAECYSFDQNYTQRAPKCNTILPYTRNVIGSMDYTPLLFNDNMYPHITTYGHELALSIVFESGWLHMGDSPSGYTSLPDFAQSFLKVVPTVWDEVKYLAGMPGQDIVLARRKGNQWYIAGINGENTAKHWDIDLTSLNTKGQVAIITDGAESRYLISLAQTGLSLDILPYGGFVATVGE